MTPEKQLIEKVRDLLLGSSNDSEYAQLALQMDGFTEGQIEVAINNAEIECCACCGWWVEESEVTEEDDEFYCEDCIGNF